jgi:hypothetical protein
MLTKMMAAVVMTGALWVAGDAASKNLGCCFLGSLCCSPTEDCCYGVKNTSTETDCCSPGTVCCDPPTDCCVGGTQPATTQPAAKPGCCSSTK